MACFENFRDNLPNSTDFPLSSADDWSPWHITVQSALDRCDLVGYIDGSIVQPSDRDPTYITWRTRDRRVRSYLINSVDRSIRADLTGFTSSAALWTHLCDRFVEKSGSREYQLLIETQTATQGDLSAQTLYGRMRANFRELRALEPGPMATPAEREAFRDRRELYQYLMALRPEFSALAGQLIHRDPLPRLVSAVAEVVAEETRLRTIALRRSTPSSTYEGVLAATPTSLPGSSRKNTVCAHCKKPGHPIADCWKLHPEKRFGPKGRGQRRTTAPFTSAAVATEAPSSYTDHLGVSERVSIS
ncbi:hypothetical protein QJS10_CPA07g01230 [Acorus calamus]|uniref:CCHC-type domain-containing protein n=1 Tax=Acorus calamus TaxID=4465 RepID=A0AAV9EEU2_ACOCL|nr:hypothetical protein QJS10_CPA07g01230 [Acorus calamus]